MLKVVIPLFWKASLEIVVTVEGITTSVRLFIKLYYLVSPTIVKYFGQTKLFQTFWRKRLDKFVERLHAQGVSEKPYVDKNW